jgi:hypothetical protein
MVNMSALHDCTLLYSSVHMNAVFINMCVNNFCALISPWLIYNCSQFAEGNQFSMFITVSLLCVHILIYRYIQDQEKTR